MTINFHDWTKATAELPWGAQRAFHDTLQAVADEKIKLVYGANYYNGSPCLVNAVGAMLRSHSKATSGSDNEEPSQYYGNVVVEFDSYNSKFRRAGVNPDHFVSPLAAEILLKNFATLKPVPVKAQVDDAMRPEAFAEHVHYEPSDSDLMNDWLHALNDDAVCEDAALTFKMTAPPTDDELIKDVANERVDRISKQS